MSFSFSKISIVYFKKKQPKKQIIKNTKIKIVGCQHFSYFFRRFLFDNNNNK